MPAPVHAAAEEDQPPRIAKQGGEHVRCHNIDRQKRGPVDDTGVVDDSADGTDTVCLLSDVLDLIQVSEVADNAERTAGGQVLHRRR